MDYKITKLDRRHSGYSFYEYYVEPATWDGIRGAQLLTEYRNWCWETYGPAAELGWNKRGSLWAWDTEHGKRRIYLQSSKELMLFKLRWS